MPIYLNIYIYTIILYTSFSTFNTMVVQFFFFFFFGIPDPFAKNVDKAFHGSAGMSRVVNSQCLEMQSSIM